MKKVFGYIRVSTLKQGEKGVSLQEQRASIERYCQAQNFSIVEWFEERQTAAKRGRPIFGRMLSLLNKGQVQGVVIHKIDRSARNLKDWANLGEMIDRGVDIHFANESLDLRSRGGRLSADIQAVVAADYIRNLKEETRKGFYGRLKQGVYPLPAPRGYLNQGKGIPKTIDPVSGPLVQKAFELYATGRYSLHTLRHELFKLGLRAPSGKPYCRNSLSILLHNPFYVGLIRIHRTGEMFEGNHPPLIRKSVFDRVQLVLKGRITAGPQRHGYTFRRLFTCAKCGNTLTGEGHKGHVYYRCHTRGCNQASVREEAIDAAIEAAFIPLQFSNRERLYLQGKLRTLKTNWQTTTERELRSLELRHNEVRERLSRLTDAVIDKLINKCEYEERKAELLMEQQDIAERKEAMTASTGSLGETVTKFFELAESLYLGYKMGIPAEKRDLIKMATSNRTVNGKDVVVKPCFPFDLIAKRSGVLKGAPSRARLRTLDEMLAKVVGHFESNPESASRLRGHGDFRDVEGQDCAA